MGEEESDAPSNEKYQRQDDEKQNILELLKVKSYGQITAVII